MDVDFAEPEEISAKSETISKNYIKEQNKKVKNKGMVLPRG